MEGSERSSPPSVSPAWASVSPPPPMMSLTPKGPQARHLISVSLCLPLPLGHKRHLNVVYFFVAQMLKFPCPHRPLP